MSSTLTLVVSGFAQLSYRIHCQSKSDCRSQRRKSKKSTNRITVHRRSRRIQMRIHSKLVDRTKIERVCAFEMQRTYGLRGTGVKHTALHSRMSWLSRSWLGRRTLGREVILSKHKVGFGPLSLHKRGDSLRAKMYSGLAVKQV